jgi:hypothetical protein
VPAAHAESQAVRFLKLDRWFAEAILISFDPAHRAVHCPPDRRFRIWIRPSSLIGIGIAILSVIAASWIEVAVAGLLMFQLFLRYILTTSQGRTGFRFGFVTAPSSICFL